MDQIRTIQLAIQMISEEGGKVKALHARLEDIQFRSQRIESWLKKQACAQAAAPDRAFPDDLRLLRRDIKRFSQEFQNLPARLSQLERAAVYEPDAEEKAAALYRSAGQFQNAALALLAPAQLAYQHIRQAECRIEAWFLTQELESFATAAAALPIAGNKILLKISTPPKPGASQ